MIAKWQIVGMINWGIYSIQRKFAPPPSTMHNGPHDKVGGGGWWRFVDLFGQHSTKLVIGAPPS